MDNTEDLKMTPQANARELQQTSIADGFCGIDILSDLYRLPERKNEGRFKVTKDKFYH